MTALDRPLSYSQLSTFLRCPKLWDYRYKQGLVSLRPSAALRIGSLVDSGITAALIEREQDTIMSCAALSDAGILLEYDKWSTSAGISQALAMSAEFADESAQVRDDSMNIARRAIADLNLDGGEWSTASDVNGKLGVQYEVRRPLRAHHHGYIGYIDWIAYRQTALWLIDFKTRKAFKNDDQLGFDYQLATYEHAVGDVFGRIAGVAHYQIKSKPTTPPKVLKSGKLSRDKTQSCDWPTYKDAIILGMYSHVNYADMEHVLPKFQAWTWTRRSPTELANTWAQVETLAEVVVDAHHSTRPMVRVLNDQSCTKCDMRAVCMAELKGHDSEFIRKSNYKVREDYGPTTSQ